MEREVQEPTAGISHFEVRWLVEVDFTERLAVERKVFSIVEGQIQRIRWLRIYNVAS